MAAINILVKLASYGRRKILTIYPDTSETELRLARMRHYVIKINRI